MAYKIPWSNFHELNLDWILDQIKELRKDVDNITGSATPYTFTPEMDGIGSPGTEVSYARGDHRHPTDTSRASAADLAQEILDRGAADDTLQANIDATDAKIKFSSSAPYMDSSSASAGFSDYMARADHVHPTDTSRASATDVATLQARMDAFSGSAAPSDTTPLMDGVGAAGTGGNYSRGDHVHPSDTSKLNKAGGTITGDLTIEGSLIEELRRQYITTNAIGWLRSIQAPLVYGTRIEITIARKGTIAPAEVHKIAYVYDQAGPAFVDESSTGDVKYIDKIRITDAGRIDIHMDQTADSQIGVFITAAAPTNAVENNIQMLEIEGVADAPAGETVIAVYDFHKDISSTVKDISSSVSLNFTAIEKTATVHNGIIDLFIETYFESYVADYEYTIGSIAAEYAPKANVFFTGHTVNDGFNPRGLVTFTVYANGNMTVRINNTDGSYPILHATYSIF